MIDRAELQRYVGAMSDLAQTVQTLWKATPFGGAPDPLVTHLELRGVIGEAALASRGLTHQRVSDAIKNAFKPKRLSAVAVSINSPGGSPVQSRLIFQSIRRAAETKNVPVFAFIEDEGASGGYILALAGDEIYADESSVVGSIGVIAATFGLQEAMARWGIERRIHTAGRHKSQLDPFRPEDPEDVARLNSVLESLHADFIALVKRRRGDKLSAHEDLFSGAFWTAEPARERGLIDGTAHLGDFLKARFGEHVKVRKVSSGRLPLWRLLLGGRDADISRSDDWLSAIEARSVWARYGL